MKHDRKQVLSLLVFATVLLAAGVAAAAQAPSSTDPPVISWQPPSSYSMAPAPGFTKFATTVGVGPAPFYPIVPCRQYDSRSSSALADNTPRSVTLAGAPCGVPGGTWALAVNITVFSITGAGSNGVFKVGTASPPTTAWINYPPTETQRGNAGVVATNGTAIYVQINQGAGSVHFTVDVYGYYYNGLNASPWDMTTGDMFSIIGSKDGYPIIFGRNNSTAANSFGVVGRSYSTGAGSAGVWGDAVGATGVVNGVMGTADSFTSGAAGVFGQVGSTGFSNTSFVSGVIGLADGGSFPVGVVGLGTYRGVTGWRVDAGGALQTYGILGSQGVDGVLAGGNLAATGTKTFVEPHPTEVGKVIKYAALEGPESGTYFRGRSRFEGKVAVIPVPEDFRLVSDEEGLTVHVTPIGAAASVWVSKMDLNDIVIQSTRDVEFSYIVHGVRKAYRDFTPIEKDLHYFIPLSPTDRLQEKGLVPALQERLVATGVYNADGTVNMATAERMGWAQKWRDAEKVRAEAARQPQAPKTQGQDAGGR